MSDKPDAEILNKRIQDLENRISDLEMILTKISQVTDPRTVRIRDPNQMKIHRFGSDE